MKTSERIAWLLIGVAAGAGIALLYAPMSGRDTRKFIRRKAEDTRDTVVDKTGQIRDALVETGESIAEAGRDVYRKGTGLASSAASGAANFFDMSRKAAKG
jgi:gas vesicle protein